MKKYTLIIGLFLVACGSQKTVELPAKEIGSQDDILKIAFGSCNKVDVPNVFWDDILAFNPSIWIWGGDNIYADTNDVEKIKEMYVAQNEIEDYKKLRDKIAITGVWDDHDYGLNDGGEEFEAKEASQQAFLDFMGVSKEDSRRKREGTYSRTILGTPQGVVHIYNLDTRYFRSQLKNSTDESRRYAPDSTTAKTILGEKQWKWLERELSNSEADFNVIVSSIQFLSDKHGFEKWANFPREVGRMKEIIVKSGAKGVIFLSGDRHISEFSKIELEGLSYPLIDFTSSGLTHSYSSFKGEENPHRIGDVVSSVSYGTLEIDFRTRKVKFRIMGDENAILQEIDESY